MQVLVYIKNFKLQVICTISDQETHIDTSFKVNKYTRTQTQLAKIRVVGFHLKPHGQGKLECST